jgi:flagellar biosynthesis/type III secretory pathway protein FliH
MSSYKRIPKAAIKISEQKVVFNDRYASEEDLFKKTSIETYLEESKEKINEEERKMLEKIDEKKEELIQKGYEQGKERAILEAKEQLQEEFQDTLNQANEIYQEANKFYEKMLNEQEELKNQFLMEKKEELIDFILAVTEKIIHQQVNMEHLDIEKMYDESIHQIKYDTSKIFVRVHPETQERLQQYKSVLLDKRIEFRYDLTLEKTDFILETEREFIDLSVQTQLEEMKDYLRSVIDAES